MGSDLELAAERPYEVGGVGVQEIRCLLQGDTGDGVVVEEVAQAMGKSTVVPRWSSCVFLQEPAADFVVVLAEPGRCVVVGHRGGRIGDGVPDLCGSVALQGYDRVQPERRRQIHGGADATDRSGRDTGPGEPFAPGVHGVLAQGRTFPLPSSTWGGDGSA
jgi:hypothetical protein